MGDRKRWVLGIFAKWPHPGAVKTRLAQETSPEWAAAVAHAFLRDTLDRLATFPAQRYLVYAPTSAREAFEALAAKRFTLEPQGTGDLGQRLANFFRAHVGEAGGPVLVIGTDSPSLPWALVEQAGNELEHADVVVGPATDGGYYLLGCRSWIPSLFEGIDWSSPRVLQQTIHRLQELSARLALLPPWYDIDTLSDWEMLVGHLAAMRRAGMNPALPHLTKLLYENAP